MFANVDALGGFGLGEIAFLYGGTALCLGFADLVVGNVERLGSRIRTGSLDAMMVRPVSLFVQVCADQFAFRRVGRILQGGAVLAWGAFARGGPLDPVAGADDPGPRGLRDADLHCAVRARRRVPVHHHGRLEAANAFTYGGNTLTQYPLTIYPTEAVKALTFIVPVAFVNWYPSLYILDRPDPFGLPAALSSRPPSPPLALCALAWWAWTTGVRRYRSTGS